jgi:hypothetical protein
MRNKPSYFAKRAKRAVPKCQPVPTVSRWRRHEEGYLFVEVQPANVLVYVFPVAPSQYSDGKWGVGMLYGSDPDAQVYATHTYLTEAEAIRAGDRFVADCFAGLREPAYRSR